MPEPVENHLPSAAVLADVLARQAAALHVVFMRGFFEIVASKQKSRRDANRVLRTQNQCRKALRLLTKLREVEQYQNKGEIERTDY